jgi:arginine decarboxylase-like protein
MGRHIFIVVEKLNELKLIAKIAKRLKISPNIGIRVQTGQFRQWQMGRFGRRCKQVWPYLQ